MKTNIITKNCIHHQYLNSKAIKRLKFNFEKILKTLENKKNEFKSLEVLNKNYKFNFNSRQLLKYKKYKTIVIIGMGGSVLGTEAIYNFLKDKVKKKIIFLNDIDIKKITLLNKNINKNKTLFLIISKSGNTIETISNMFSLDLLKKNKKNVIFVSEKNKGILFSLAKKYNLPFIEHKKFIGGRYSVLSEVGILPSYLMGLNISKFRNKLKTRLSKSEKKFFKESTSQLAYLLSKKKMNNLVFLNYSPKLEAFMYWCQQLIAESLGKNNTGFFPVISNVPKDHHSLLQLYLDGPKDKVFNIFSLDEKFSKKINTKNVSLAKHIKNRSLNHIKEAQKNALIKAFKKKNIPYRIFKIKKSNEETLGQLFSYFILETVMIGKLLKINPFDQPAVEQVKLFTKELLN